jgi:hypothetical protein
MESSEEQQHFVLSAFGFRCFQDRQFHAIGDDRNGIAQGVAAEGLGF